MKTLFGEKNNKHMLASSGKEKNTPARWFAEININFETNLSVLVSTIYESCLSPIPNLFQKVPQKYIASYLGASEQSLSRIKSVWFLNKCECLSGLSMFTL